MTGPRGISTTLDILIPKSALVLVADGRRARFLRNQGTPRQLDFVTEQEFEQENPPTREQGTDRPGRYSGVDGTSRNAMDQTDWHQLAEDRFAADVAAIVYRMAHAHAFERMLVVAAPKVLGKLRTAFHPEVTARVIAEVPKDLTSHSLEELNKLLS